MRVLLTGAGGFVGRRILSQLKAQGFFVRALSRRHVAVLKLADEVIIESLSPRSDYKSHLLGIDTLIHLADGFNAYEHLPADATIQQATRKLAITARLAEAAAQNGTRFVYLSTIKAMCGTHCDNVLDEHTPPQPTSLYGQLKLQAEQIILRTTQQYESQAVILRFPIVFGGGVGGNMQKLLRVADTPVPLPLKGMRNRRSLVSSRSLIDAVMTIIMQKEVGEGVYLVHDDAISPPELICSLRKGLQRRELLFFVPERFWRLGAKLPGLYPICSRLACSLVVDDQKFRRTYGWYPRKTLSEALMEFAADYTK